jgi:hypothetical protein
MLDSRANGHSNSRFFIKIENYLKYKSDTEGKGGIYFIIDTKRAEEIRSSCKKRERESGCIT